MLRSSSSFLLAGAYWYLSSPDKARVALEDMQGQAPKLTTPRRENFPTINIAKVVGWPEGAKPSAASGLKVAAFAEKLDHPRWLLELPNGDILVAESLGPEKAIPRHWGQDCPQHHVEGRWHRDFSRSHHALARCKWRRCCRIPFLVFLDGLHSPFGMALVGETLYVANTDAVLAFPYKTGETKIAAKGTKILDLPSSPPNNHWARNLIAAPDGQSLYITVGSNSNIAEGGMDKEQDRALIRQYDLKTKQSLA